MDIKYNIYYSVNPNGPWTLANSTPIDHQDSLMSYFINGLDPRTRYYVQVLGGFINSSDEFIPLRSQPIGPVNVGANAITSSGGSGKTAPPSIEVITFGPRVVISSGSLTHTFSMVSLWAPMSTGDAVENFTDDTAVNFCVMTDWNRYLMHPSLGTWTQCTFETGITTEGWEF